MAQKYVYTLNVSTLSGLNNLKERFYEKHLSLIK